MTANNEITLDMIDAFFSLDREVTPLDIAPTATGGAGINNLDRCPAPKPHIPAWRRIENSTDYVKKYQEKEEEITHSIQNLHLSSICSLNDVESSSEAFDAANLNDLHSDVTKQIYSTYFSVPRNYNMNLTISSYREEILQQLNISPVVIIQGPTGCGKTTQVPQYILDYHQAQGTYCNIIVTQPRKIAAISIARRVCHERKWELGSITGYQVAMDAKVSSDTRLCYVTTGVLLEKFVNAKRMDMYTHVIIDEVHERNQETDFALLLVKKFLKTNSQRVKVILMSATFDSSLFANYFALSKPSHAAPVIEILGKSKDVTEHYLHELSTLLPKFPDFDLCSPKIDPSLYEAVIKLMFVFDKIEKAEQNVPNERPYAPHRGAVLIFLPGYEEISALSNKLESASLSQNFWIIPLHSTITVDEQTKVFRNPPADHRKVILSTNIAESSITVPDVKYVIDFCLTKNLVTDPGTNYTCLRMEWASKSNCIQRKGRAGRVDTGKAYRMVPRSFYEDFANYNVPEIKRCPLIKTILQVKKLNICEPQEMLSFAIDPPNFEDICNAILELKEALALTSRDNTFCDGDLTFVGRVMANLPLDVKLSKLIIFGYVFYCLEECIIIAACLSLQTFFARPFDRVLDAYRSKLAWSEDTFSDCLTFLNAYKVWKQHLVQGFFRRPYGLTELQWAERHFIQVRRIREVDQLVKEIKNRLECMQITVDYKPGDVNYNALMLKLVIAGAFFPNYYHQEPLNENEINREVNGHDPLATVILLNLPTNQGILYACALKDMFLCCGETADIEFEGKKAYVKFPRSLQSSAVLRSVYLAVKMRKLKTCLELSVFSPEDAERKLKQLMPASSKESNRITVKNSKPLNTECPSPNANIPSLQDGIIEIFISHVNSCGSFWAQQIRKISNLLRFIEFTINSSQELQALENPPEVDHLYLAPFISNNTKYYYRAQIKSLNNNNAIVFFVDYGNSSSVSIKDLRKISEETPDVLNTPFLAFECQLAEVKPSVLLSKTEDWCEEANHWFKKEVNGMTLFAKIYSVVQNITRLEILKRGGDGLNYSINKRLVSLKYAVSSEENFISKHNHELRLKASNYVSSDVASNTFSNDFQMSWKKVAEFDRIRKTGRKIQLKGPFSPLEATYSGLTMVDHSKCIKIERNSVNSVSMNSNPEDQFPTLLVASHLGLSGDNKDLIVRNTTLMPKVRGLTSLISLIFSPSVEIRTDKARKNYTGALCGLGFDPVTKEPIYPEHDIELPFDIKITLQDIIEVNSIRMCVNWLLSSETEIFQFNVNNKTNRERAQEILLKLLKKKRTVAEPIMYRQPYQWNQIPPDLVMEPSVDYTADSPDVLPLLRPSCLLAPSTENADIKKELRSLEIMSVNPTDEYKIIRCRLCSKDVTSTRELACHLESSEHIQKAKKIGQ